MNYGGSEDGNRLWSCFGKHDGEVDENGLVTGSILLQDGEAINISNDLISKRECM